ncbi:phenylalanine--tRNA ligase beta subunit-related protein [Brevibacillus ruminantium]|uniref:Phenylalanine--tRNA ligase beta subunit-related protein n=1 Tax=Brevibacillus ruminantium TaxID=2950604 RepID=A0ABY4WD74_9BACL|nr:phenylalanine--tRNA ligase beta subunit-related protein [Brevibacillus ruminantium]USG64709.1 phenylalanine--tRNA ligase beta subunit-related protein [Brevibacillus ruminantium]
MTVRISPELAEILPSFALGVLRYTDVTVSPSPKMLQGRINLFVESLRLEHELSRINEIEGVTQWRSGFKRLGIDPSRYRPSSEALLRRLLQGNPFFWINSAVDVNNFLSVLHALPYGIYDEAKLEGDVVCRLGQASDVYEGLNGRDVHMEGKLVLADELGAFGSPIVDSKRTPVEEGSTSLMQVIFFHEQLTPEQQQEILGSTARMFTEINGGEVRSSIIVTAR